MKYIFLLVVAALMFSCQNKNQSIDRLNLSDRLVGKWKATAFSGELHEEWKLGKDGWMTQRGYYIEKNDTSYSASTKIEKVNDALILFSVIKGSNPKIFQAERHQENEIVFENKEYKNPFQVKYEFLDKDNYRRTITGYEGDSLVRYVFNFEKMN